MRSFLLAFGIRMLLLPTAATAQVWEEVGGSASHGGISNGALGASSSPSVAGRPGAALTVAWLERTDPQVPQVYLRRYDDATGNWIELGGSASGQGISRSPFGAATPTLALGPDGQPVVAWQERVTSDRFEIHLARWNGSSWQALGSSRSADGLSAGPGNSTFPSLAIDSAGSPVVAWQEQFLNSPMDPIDNEAAIFVKRWNAEEGRWTHFGADESESGISGRYYAYFPNASVDAPKIALDHNGRPTVAWSAVAVLSVQVFLTRWDPDSEAWRNMYGEPGPGVVSDASAFAWEVALGLAPDGRPVVAWSEYSNSSEQGTRVLVVEWVDAGWRERAGSGGGEELVTTGGFMRSPALHVHPSGDITVAWVDDDAPESGRTQVYAQRWNRDLGLWSEMAGSASGGGISDPEQAFPLRKASAPSLAIAPDGAIATAWVKIDSGGGNQQYHTSEVYLRRRMPAILAQEPSQHRPDGQGTAIPSGGIVAPDRVELRAEGLSLEASGLWLEAEVQVVGVDFNQPPLASASGAPGGLGPLSVVVASLLPGTRCHWRARARDDSGAASAWVSFGSEDPDETDFWVRGNAAPVPLNPVQIDPLTGLPLEIGREIQSQGFIIMECRHGDPDGDDGSLDVEVRPLGSPFQGSPTASGVPGEDASMLSVNVPVDHGVRYRWQYRITDRYGASSTWVAFGGNSDLEPDFITESLGSRGRGIGDTVSCSASPASRSFRLLASILAFSILAFITPARRTA